MEATSSYPQAQFTVTLDDVNVLGHIKTLLKQMKGVRSVRVSTPKVNMTESEFYAKIDRSLAQTNNGPTYTMQPNESGEDFLNRMIQSANSHV